MIEVDSGLAHIDPFQMFVLAPATLVNLRLPDLNRLRGPESAAAIDPWQVGETLQFCTRDRGHLCVGIRIACRMRAIAVQQGRSEVRDAKEHERHVCGRARAGERPVSQRRIVLVPYGEPLRDARTPLAAFFRILLQSVPQLWRPWRGFSLPAFARTGLLTAPALALGVRLCSSHRSPRSFHR